MKLNEIYPNYLSNALAYARPGLTRDRGCVDRRDTQFDRHQDPSRAASTASMAACTGTSSSSHAAQSPSTASASSRGPMSALPPKADVNGYVAGCLLMTQSGHYGSPFRSIQVDQQSRCMPHAPEYAGSAQKGRWTEFRSPSQANGEGQRDALHLSRAGFVVQRQLCYRWR
jgi:hypothetical protein